MVPADTLDARYALGERIGEGGVGCVFRAVDRATGQVVAVKLLHEQSPRTIERFAEEARVLAAVGHPHVVGYVAHGVTGAGDPYLAMDWLEGESLLERLVRGPLGVEESLDLAHRVADALAVAHAHGIVHRDVKPSNLFLVGGAASGVRVLDFGMATAVRAFSVSSRSRSVVGTPGYMAPEQARGGPERVDARADVFSLGAVLFQCLTGRRAFPGVHTMAVLAQLLLAEPPHVRDERPELPAALDALVARLLAKEPASRPADGATVLAALEALGPSGEGVLHSRPPPPAAAAITAAEKRLLAVIAVATGTTPALPDAIATIQALAPGGARVDEIPGFALLVTLTGAPSATDQAQRAARCALRLRAALPGALVAAAMGQGEAGGRIPVGPVVERAAELLTSSREGDPARIDDVLHALLDRRFEVRTDGRSGFLLAGERDIGAGARTLLGKPSPYVGRERELHMLRELLRETFTGDRGAQAAVVAAAAGMGKTRLRHELVKSLRGTLPDLAIATGRADAMSAGSAFVVVASALRSAMGIGAGDSAAATRASVVSWLARLLPAGDQRRVGAFLCEMMGAPSLEGDLPELRAARHHAARMADELARAFVDFVRGVCAQRPVLLVLEDLHWGDAASMRLVDQALRDLEDQPFVVLALARPEVHELFPDLWSKRGVQNIRLGPLPRRAAEELVTRALEGSTPPVPAAVVGSLIERAGGNAFYLEEVIRAYAAHPSHELPETVLGMVAARLEALPAAPRLLLRAASVFGETFPGAGAAALLAEADRDEARRRWLPWLVQHEILVRRPGAGEDAHAFRHALLREGSYAMLTERDRALGHRLAGAFLEDQMPDTGDGRAPGGAATQAAVIGEHFFRGEEWARALLHFGRAGDAARGLHANGEARAHYRRALAALDRLPDGVETRRRRIDLVLDSVGVSYGDDPGPNLALLAGAEALAAALPGVAAPPSDDFRRLASVHFWMGRCHWYRGAYPEAVGYYQRVLAAARELGDDELAALPSGTLGRVLLAQGHFGRTMPLLEASLGPLARGENWAEWVVNAGFVGVSLALRGHAAEAVAQGERVLAQARALRSPTSESVALTMLGVIRLLSGDPARGRTLFGAAVEAADRGGDRVYAFVAHGFGAWADSRLGRQDAAAEGMERARAVMTELGRRLVFSDWFEAFGIEAAALAGRTAEALAEAERLLPSSHAAGSVFAEGVAHRGAGTALARAGNDLDAALHHFAESVRLLDAEAQVEAARTRLAAARVHRRRGDAEAAAREMEAAARVLDAAEIAGEPA